MITMDNKEPHSSRYFFTAVILISISLLGGIYSVASTNAYVADLKEYKSLIEYNPFESLLLEAEGSYVYAPNEDRVFFSKSATKPLPLASITKIMTAMVALENIPETASLRVMREDLLTDGQSGLLEGELWQPRDLINFTLIVSSNDGAQTLARETERFLDEGNTFVEEMNKRAKEIGMEDTVFYNPTGLDESEETAGAYASPKDVATLFNFALNHYPHLLEETSQFESVYSSLSGLSHTAENTNILTSSLPNIIASKTGYTDIAGGNLSIVTELDEVGPIIITVLGSSKDGRFSDVSSLYNATLKGLYLDRELAKLENETKEILKQI